MITLPTMIISRGSSAGNERHCRCRPGFLQEFAEPFEPLLCLRRPLAIGAFQGVPEMVLCVPAIQRPGDPWNGFLAPAPIVRRAVGDEHSLELRSKAESVRRFHQRMFLWRCLMPCLPQASAHRTRYASSGQPGIRARDDLSREIRRPSRLLSPPGDSSDACPKPRWHAHQTLRIPQISWRQAQGMHIPRQ